MTLAHVDQRLSLFKCWWTLLTTWWVNVPVGESRQKVTHRLVLSADVKSNGSSQWNPGKVPQKLVLIFIRLSRPWSQGQKCEKVGPGHLSTSKHQNLSEFETLSKTRRAEICVFTKPNTALAEKWHASTVRRALVECCRGVKLALIGCFFSTLTFWA